ncbi:MAG: Hsp20/alpha crystallin family protein [Candidatus Geothermarchaeales archaeon]
MKGGERKRMKFLTDWFREFEKLRERMVKSMEEEMRQLHQMAEGGQLPGEWEFKPIEGPNYKGYVFRGHFGLPRGTEAQRDLRGRFEQRTSRDPLVDIVREKDATKFYFEIPGVEKDDIRLNVADGKLQVKAGRFRKTVQIEGGLDPDKATSAYRNGVLEVKIPKTSKKKGKKSLKIE